MKNYYKMTEIEQNKVKQDICNRAYREIPNNGNDKVISIDNGITIGVINSIKKDDRNDILMYGEYCAVGMGRFLDDNNYALDVRYVGSEGVPTIASKTGALSNTITDFFGFVFAKKLDAAFLGAFQVAANGDLANLSTDWYHKTGAGESMAICYGAKKVYICMIEETQEGISKLVKTCNIPLTGRKCVDLIFTDKGVYKPMGDEFKILEAYNQETGFYEKI